MVPRNEKENLEVVDIAEDYYQVVVVIVMTIIIVDIAEGYYQVNGESFFRHPLPTICDHFRYLDVKIIIIIVICTT